VNPSQNSNLQVGIGRAKIQSLPPARGNDWIYALPILTSSYRDCLLLK